MHGHHFGWTDGRDTKGRPIGGLEREQGWGWTQHLFAYVSGVSAKQVCDMDEREGGTILAPFFFHDPFGL